MKRIKKVFFCRQNGKRCFSCEERVVYDIDLISNKVKEKIRKIREKRGKIRKTWSMTKKRSSEIFAAKMEIFPEKNVILVGEKIFRPPKLAASFPPLVRRNQEESKKRFQKFHCTVVCMVCIN